MTPEQRASERLFADPNYIPSQKDRPFIDPKGIEPISWNDLVARYSGAHLVTLAGLNVYLAGPMRGLPGHNFPAFHEAAAKLRNAGKHVFNPAECTGDESIMCKDTGMREALAIDLDWICKHADAIALLPGWRNSKGATAEHATAVALGLEVVEL